ncbi:Plasma kallikrein [Coemansia sp. RSA 2607]|nr:Plasma kallikrein [Coemansia sp. RSA 2607]
MRWNKRVASARPSSPLMVLAVLLTFSLAVSAKVVFKGAPSKAEWEHLGRVIGGSDASQGEFPFAAFLMVDEGDQTAFCGGTIIGRQWILTAGHCVVDTSSGGHSLNVSIPISRPRKHVHTEPKRHPLWRKYSTVKPKNIVVGIGNIYNARAAPYRVSKVYAHPDLNLDYFDNDVALLKLKKKLSYNAQVQPIRIDTETPTDGQRVTGVGWGKTSVESQTTADVLQTVDLTLGNEALCQRIRPRFTGNDGNYICVTTPDGRDTCSGDSGGPLLRRCNGDPAQQGAAGSGAWVQLGITSYGDNSQRTDDTVCAATDGAGFYTHAAAYLDWISKTSGIKREALAATCNGNQVSVARSSDGCARAAALGTALVAAAAATLVLI